MMLHISSVIVQVVNSALPAVSDYISSLENTSVSASDPLQGKLIVVLEAGTLRDTEAMIDALKSIEGVISATMVYHHNESTSELNQPLYEQAL